MTVLEDKVRQRVAKAKSHLEGPNAHKNPARTKRVIDECNDAFEEANQILDYLETHRANVPLDLTRYTLLSAPGYTRTPKDLVSLFCTSRLISG
jgi:hypothetical protein